MQLQKILKPGLFSLGSVAKHPKLMGGFGLWPFVHEKECFFFFFVSPVMARQPFGTPLTLTAFPLCSLQRVVLTARSR